MNAEPPAQAGLANLTSFLPFFPRLLSRAASLGDVWDKIRAGGSMIAEPTSTNATNTTMATTAGSFVQESVAAAASAPAGLHEDIGMWQTMKNVTSFFGYLTSKWAIATFIVVSLIKLAVYRPLPFTHPPICRAYC